MNYREEIARIEELRAKAQKNFCPPDRYLKNIEASCDGKVCEGRQGGNEEYMRAIEDELGLESHQIAKWRNHILYQRWEVQINVIMSYST